MRRVALHHSSSRFAGPSFLSSSSPSSSSSSLSMSCFGPARIQPYSLQSSDCSPGIINVSKSRNRAPRFPVFALPLKHRSMQEETAFLAAWNSSSMVQLSTLGKSISAGCPVAGTRAPSRPVSAVVAEKVAPTSDQPSITFGIIPHPSESKQEVLQYLRNEGIDTTELEEVELPSSLDVVRERIEFLQKIGLSKDDINNYPLVVSCSVKKNIIPVLDYLEQLGVTPKKLPGLLRKYPMVLQSSVVIDLMPVIDFLCGLDIKKADIAHVLVRFPDVLGFRLEGTISTSVAYLVSIGVRTRSIGPMLTQYPEILGMRVANTIKPKVEFLMNLGIPKNIVASMLEVRPYLLGLSLEELMQPAIDSLLEAGVRMEALADVVTQFPDILGQNLDEKLQRKTRWLMKQVKVDPCDVPRILEKLPEVLYIKESLAMKRVTYFLDAGLSAHDVAKMVTNFPQLLAMSIQEAIEPNFDFLQKVMKRPIEEVVVFPQYFSYDLESRIKPRHESIVQKGIQCSLEWFLNCSNKKFKQRLEADYIDDEEPGPMFKMGGPLPMGVHWHDEVSSDTELGATEDRLTGSDLGHSKEDNDPHADSKQGVKSYVEASQQEWLDIQDELESDGDDGLLVDDFLRDLDASGSGNDSYDGDLYGYEEEMEGDKMSKATYEGQR